MSLFSNTDRKTLTPTPMTIASAGYSGEAQALFKLVSLSVLLGFLMALSVISIFIVRLRPAPSFPGTQTGDGGNTPRFVQALDTLHNIPECFRTIMVSKGGEYYD